MKKLLIIYLLFSSYSFAQDTLYHSVPGLGHEKFVLKENGTFVYSSHLCGFSSYAFGSYNKNMLGYKFFYDSTLCPKPSILEIEHKAGEQNLTVFFFNVLDSCRENYSGSLVFGQQKIKCDSDSIVISKLNLNSTILNLENRHSKYSFAFDSSCTKLQVYINPLYSDISSSPYCIKKLRKTKRGYLKKRIVFDENREKPWKKGTRRVVRHYYKLL